MKNSKKTNPFWLKARRETTLRTDFIEDGLHGDIAPVRKNKRELPRQRQMVELAVQGFNTREIATMVEATPASVSNTLRQPHARERLVRSMKESTQAEIKSILERVAPGAIERVVTLSEIAESEQVRLAANRDLLDRILGKPTQTILTEEKSVEKLSDDELRAKIATLEGGLAPA